ncbi:hypothetical protein CMK17_21040 [Candidatus Poribacteria bacterium]|nr:hypothetical protein [Candidatus Poribacteria bacterium]
MAKSLFCTVLFLMVTTFSAVDGRPVIPKDLVLYWSFDNPTVKGKAAKDILGTREGRLEGNPKASAGKFGQRLEFDGKSDFAAMDQIDLGDFTVEAWFKALSAPGTWSRVFDFGKGGPGISLSHLIMVERAMTSPVVVISVGGRVDFGSGEKTNTMLP